MCADKSTLELETTRAPAIEVSAQGEFTRAAEAIFAQCALLDRRVQSAVPPLTNVLTEQFNAYLQEQEIEWSPQHVQALAGSIGFNMDQLPQSLIDADPQKWVDAIKAGMASFQGLQGADMDRKTLGSLVTAWGIGRFFRLNLDETQSAKSRAVQDALAIAEASELIPPNTRETIWGIMKITADRAAMRVEDPADKAGLTEPFNKILYNKPFPSSPDFSTTMQRPFSDYLRNMNRVKTAVYRLNPKAQFAQPE